MRSRAVEKLGITLVAAALVLAVSCKKEESYSSSTEVSSTSSETSASSTDSTMTSTSYSTDTTLTATGMSSMSTDTTMTSTATTASSTGTVPDTAKDKDFIKDAAMGGLAEVQMGNLAVQKATNPDVKNFGQQMVTDHSKANSDFASVVGPKGVVPPTVLDKKHQDVMDELSKKSGADFDKAYMKEMVKDHDMDVPKFEKESKSGEDPDVKAFAARTLPTLQGHQKMAKDVSKKLK